MNVPTWSVGWPCVRVEVRTELARRGLDKRDFDRRGIDVDELDREVLRTCMGGRRMRVVAILGDILDRVGLGSRATHDGTMTRSSGRTLGPPDAGA